MDNEELKKRRSEISNLECPPVLEVLPIHSNQRDGVRDNVLFEENKELEVNQIDQNLNYNNNINNQQHNPQNININRIQFLKYDQPPAVLINRNPRTKRALRKCCIIFSFICFLSCFISILSLLDINEKIDLKEISNVLESFNYQYGDRFYIDNLIYDKNKKITFKEKKSYKTYIFTIKDLEQLLDNTDITNCNDDWGLIYLKIDITNGKYIYDYGCGEIQYEKYYHKIGCGIKRSETIQREFLPIKISNENKVSNEIDIIKGFRFMKYPLNNSDRSLVNFYHEIHFCRYREIVRYLR